MKNLIFLITFCLPAVCFGQLNGRGVICGVDADGYGIESFEFGVDSVTQKGIWREGLFHYQSTEGGKVLCNLLRSNLV